MKVYKFGGASVKTPQAIENVYNIIKDENELVIVVSAIDKTTNHLERLVNYYFNGDEQKNVEFENIKKFHLDYVAEAFGGKTESVCKKLNALFEEIAERIDGIPTDDYDFEYDSIVSYGELLSTTIFSEYLRYRGKQNKFIDIRRYMVTDSNFRDAKIDWKLSEKKVRKAFSDANNNVFVTQGFIGSDISHHTTTLGREGSDYSASSIAHIIDAESVTIWKDVPGIMNADPAWCDFAEKLDEISFHEAIELAFYGAKVIHPKTIKPIENKNIPLYVRSFKDPSAKGTVIRKLDYYLDLVPVYILKQNQVLISISPKDFSFIVEENMSNIFGLFAKYKVKVNVMQNSAIDFSASIDANNRNFDALVADLQKEYFVKYNENLQLITIRYYTDEAINRMISGHKVYMTQKSRKTARFVIE
ncbi:MAG: aspartate kinase [Bacteroidales bacterium]|jgi:aspartate kinase|nr:aspartate kinase [Bacteroidales bacterium]